jgi:MFS family permease
MNQLLKKYWYFIIILGLVSLFSDMVYETGRSLYGSFLKQLEASSFVVGFFAGLGEFLGYALRYVFGRIADRTGKYWGFVILGYAINLVSVPLLAFVGMWQWAVVLIVLERIGKALRAPSKDAILASVTVHVGHGKGFAIQEVLDQLGATLGPAFMIFALGAQANYVRGFMLLFIPAVLALLFLLLAYFYFPKVGQMQSSTKSFTVKEFPRSLWMYMAAIALVAIGFADFPLIGFHIKSHEIMMDKWIPALYALIMLVDGVAAFVEGWAFDKWGIKVLFFVSFLNPILPWFIFSLRPEWIIVGAVLYGISLGAQESIFKSYLASVASDNRATLFGTFHLVYGLSWFLGSAIASYLYGISVVGMLIFLTLVQVAAIPFFFLTLRSGK